jgi:hypothetical protein
LSRVARAPAAALGALAAVDPRMPRAWMPGGV